MQKERSADEAHLFLPGLRASNVWYGHERSVCWMQTELPPGFAKKMKAAGLAQSYDESGWVSVASPRTRHTHAPLLARARVDGRTLESGFCEADLIAIGVETEEPCERQRTGDGSARLTGGRVTPGSATSATGGEQQSTPRIMGPCLEGASILARRC